MGEAYRRIVAVNRSNRFIQIIFIAAVLSFTLFLADGQRANAQSADRESVTLSPTSRQYKADVGNTIKDKLTVVNDGKTGYDFIVYARPYSINNNEYNNPDFTSATKTADLYAWVQFPKTKFHANPNTTTYVDYSVTIPKSASPGGHYGVIFVEVQPSGQQVTSGNSITRKKRVGAIIYATANGEVKLAGEVKPNSMPFWQVQPPLHTTVAAANTGNTHYIDTTQLVVSDLLGNVKYQTKKDFVVMPGTTRTMNLDWNQAPWFGLYKVATEQNFLNKSYKSEGYVLIMPRYLPVALILIIVIGGVYAMARRRKKE